LWTKVPEYGDKICICASLKDALCLWSNTGIPCIATQGEGYRISETAVKELKRRYKNIYILFDNDEAGLIDGKKLAEETGFINLVLPKINEAKDVSDLYKSLNNKKDFIDIILTLFKNEN
jgi:DNA primase